MVFPEPTTVTLAVIGYIELAFGLKAYCEKHTLYTPVGGTELLVLFDQKTFSGPVPFVLSTSSCP